MHNNVIVIVIIFYFQVHICVFDEGAHEFQEGVDDLKCLETPRRKKEIYTMTIDLE